MVEVIYRIYEVADTKTQEANTLTEHNFGLYSSTSKNYNTELLMDCLVCDNREHFKDIIRSSYGNDIAFKYSKKLKPGDLYCIIIGEHCYTTERYFNKIVFECDNCHNKVETYYNKPICFSAYDVKYSFYGMNKYLTKQFCSNYCREQYKENERKKLKPNSEQEFWITRDMFTEDISGYIYKITKKSTEEFYVGQTMYAPVFRWGQHLKTDRFPISNIIDYKFEVLEIVPKSENILEREKYHIQKCYNENPDKSLNIMCVKTKNGIMSLEAETECVENIDIN